MCGCEIDELEEFGEFNEELKCDVDDWLVWDLLVGYFVNDVLLICVCIDNIFDKEFFKLYGLSCGFDLINYNVYGICYMLSLSYCF